MAHQYEAYKNLAFLRFCTYSVLVWPNGTDPLFLVTNGYGFQGFWPKVAKSKGSYLLQGVKVSEIQVQFCKDKLGSKLDSNKKTIAELHKSCS